MHQITVVRDDKTKPFCSPSQFTEAETGGVYHDDSDDKQWTIILCVYKLLVTDDKDCNTPDRQTSVSTTTSLYTTATYYYTSGTTTTTKKYCSTMFIWTYSCLGII